MQERDGAEMMLPGIWVRRNVRGSVRRENFRGREGLLFRGVTGIDHGFVRGAVRGACAVAPVPGLGAWRYVPGGRVSPLACGHCPGGRSFPLPHLTKKGTPPVAVGGVPE